MSKIAIYPSLLSLADRIPDWDTELQKLGEIPSEIHYDVGDSDFIPSLMLDPADIARIQSDLPVGVHLMVRKPSLYFPQLFSFENVKSVIFHVECDEDVHELVQELHNAGKKVGLALLHNTPADHLDPYLLEIDHVLVMSIKGGFSGTGFIPEVLPKITEIHNKLPELPIIVDGGVNEKTLPLCAEAGATAVVMSSALFSGGDISWVQKYLR